MREDESGVLIDNAKSKMMLSRVSTDLHLCVCFLFFRTESKRGDAGARITIIPQGRVAIEPTLVFWCVWSAQVVSGLLMTMRSSEG